VRYTIVQMYQPAPLTCIQSIQFPYNQSILELNMYLKKYNRYTTYNIVAHVCMHRICYAARVCMCPNCYASCVCLLKTRVSFFLKTSDPLLLLSHRSVTYHCIQTITVLCSCILIHNLYSRKICLSLVMCHIGVCNHEQV
jgi:hypothetical protein